MSSALKTSSTVLYLQLTESCCLESDGEDRCVKADLLDRTPRGFRAFSDKKRLSFCTQPKRDRQTERVRGSPRD
ncbi:hypothetical protein PBY51_008291 [Eleginops maclovinus]|uniref:Uncharacterized protein n=1 Tax=Eleginops maclovinus TaxID=56733 RepID=A0AAN7XAQ6_ELEMC|nr:hypothetical protein PBY51_008291 [Eleginops maclovinus]